MRGMLGSSILVDFILSSHNPAAWGPFVAALSLTYLNDGRDGVVSLLKRGVDVGFARIWWIRTFPDMEIFTVYFPSFFSLPV